MDWKSSTLPMNYPVRACLPSRTSYRNVKRRKKNGWNVTQRNATRRSKSQTASQVDREWSKVNLWVFRCHHPIRLEIQMGNDFTQTQARKRKKKIGTKKKIKNRENGLRKERVVLWCRKKNDTRLNRIYANIYIGRKKACIVWRRKYLFLVSFTLKEITMMYQLQIKSDFLQLKYFYPDFHPSPPPYLQQKEFWPLTQIHGQIPPDGG